MFLVRPAAPACLKNRLQWCKYFIFGPRTPSLHLVGHVDHGLVLDQQSHNSLVTFLGSYREASYPVLPGIGGGGGTGRGRGDGIIHEQADVLKWPVGRW